MNIEINEPIISTIKEKCKTCYTCVRECPAKAISIISGQAEVIEERCIHCGNCVKVCSQNAKKVHSSIPYFEKIIESKGKVAAIIAPSFPAEFPDINYKKVVGILKKLQFDYVNEVGFGADLVAKEYKKIIQNDTTNSYIATSCPAVVSYVEKYYPDLVSKLAPVVSPMIATARVLRSIHGPDLNLQEIAQASIDLFIHDSKSKNISINFQTKPNIIFYGDKAEFEIIFNNLISNAIKYNKDNGKVIVKMKAYNNNVSIVVADTGIGLSKEEISNLFQEFVRIKNNKTRDILGSGLGLSTVKKIVNLYRGKIKVKSKPDMGSVFRITLQK